MPFPTLTVAFVPGVSPAKWARVWNSRMEDATLVLRAIGATEVEAALGGEADMCFARLPVDGDFRAIPLWEETPVAVLEKEHPLAALPSVTLEDLEGQTVIDGHDEETLDLVATGTSIARMPQSLFRAASRKELVARPITGIDGTRIALLWSPDNTSELVEEFIGIVRGRTANSSRGAVEEQPAEPAKAAKAPRKPRPKTAAKPIPQRYRPRKPRRN